MYYTTAGRLVSPWQFCVRRLIRVMPTYFAYSTIAFALARLAPSMTRTFSGNVWDYLRSILFIPYFTASDGGGPLSISLIRPEIGQGWTLNYEVLFYAVFSLCLFFPERIRVTSLTSLCVMASMCGLAVRPQSAILRTYTDPLICEFVFGVLLGVIVVKYLPRQSGASKTGSEVFYGFILLVSGIAALFVQNQHPWNLARTIAFGLPALSIVCGSLLIDRSGLVPTWTWPLLLGNASYSLYLSHIFILGALRRLWQSFLNVHLIKDQVLFLLVSSVTAEFCAVFIFIHAERPVTLGLVNALKRRRM